jgi:hypothetical protein
MSKPWWLAAVTTILMAQQPSDPAEMLAKARDLIVASAKRPAPRWKGVSSRMQHRLEKPRHFTIGLLLEKLEVRGGATQLYAKLDRGDQSRSIVLPPMGQSRLVAALVFTTDKSRHVVPARYQTNWVTVAPPAEEMRK